MIVSINRSIIESLHTEEGTPRDSINTMQCVAYNQFHATKLHCVICVGLMSLASSTVAPNTTHTNKVTRTLDSHSYVSTWRTKINGTKPTKCGE